MIELRLQDSVLKKYQRVFRAHIASSSRCARRVRVSDGVALACVRPSWSSVSDIRWISAVDGPGLDFFQDAFEALQIPRKLEPHVGPGVVMFSGFFIWRREGTSTAWHHDFTNTNGGAFTLMAPLTRIPQKCCHLLYHDDEGETRKYVYRVGRAVVFGDDFWHSTEPGSMASPAGFLCFTLGRRDMTRAEWRHARSYIASQTGVYQTPSGRRVTPRD